jgi:hypothetical protein
MKEPDAHASQPDLKQQGDIHGHDHPQWLIQPENKLLYRGSLMGFAPIGSVFLQDTDTPNDPSHAVEFVSELRESAVPQGVVREEQSPRPDVRVGKPKLEIHVLVGMQAVVDENINLA